MFSNYLKTQDLAPLLALQPKPNFEKQIGVIAGNLTIGGMELGAIRLAKELENLGYKTWVAFKGLNDLTDHEIGAFIKEEKVNFEPWNSIIDTLNSTDIIWLSQGNFIDNPKVKTAIAKIPWILEFFGQPAAILPETNDVDICVVKSKSLTNDIKAHYKNPLHYLTIAGIPVKKAYPRKLKNKVFTFLSVSRMDNWQKRLSIIIEAANQLEGEFQLILAGDGPAKPELEALAQGNPKIKFLGWVDATKRKELLQNAHVFLSPGVWEGSSRSIREAMMYSLIILAGEAGGTSELITHEKEGMLLPVQNQKIKNSTHDVAIWLKAMQRCLDDDVIDLGKAARKRILELNSESRNTFKSLMGLISSGELRKPHSLDVSVITPAYNIEDHIKDCIVSVAKQEFKGTLEHVVVNDGSTDKTGEILDELAKRYKHLRVIHLEENGGCNEARNRAVLAANGFAILPLDADDELLGNVDSNGKVIRYNWLQTAWDIFVKHNKKCMVYGRTLRTVPEKGLIFPRTKVTGLAQLVGINDKSRQTLLPVVLHPRSACFAVEGWHWKGGGKGTGLEDSAYNIELLMAGYQLVYSDKLVYHWRFRPGSRSRVMNFQNEWNKLSEHYKPIIEELGV